MILIEWKYDVDITTTNIQQCVISANDDRYRSLFAMKQVHKWFNDREYPSLGLRRGVRTLQRITNI